jgi:Phosphatidylinositol-4-phosphate 5-Kinase
MELLLKLLPRYSAHIAEYPDTLLIKYLGLHRIKPQNGGKVHRPSRTCIWPACVCVCVCLQLHSCNCYRIVLPRKDQRTCLRCLRIQSRRSLAVCILTTLNAGAVPLETVWKCRRCASW